jgi:hypothetical protein
MAKIGLMGQSYCSLVIFETLTLGIFQSWFKWFKDNSEAEAARMPNGSQVTLGAGQNRIPFISK